ncbi:MAG: adenylate kinase [Candidatus Micrarchaeota archaeon]|nr:adenylate kinase [Candidatus Micrarchaeota archaeon]
MIVVMGLPGAGKTTVLQGAIAGFGEWKVLNYGDLMFEIAKGRGLVSHRDDMRKLPSKEQQKVQKEASEKLEKAKGKVILDTHCSIHSLTGYMPGLPFEQLGKLPVDYLVFISAPARDILGRRQRDTTRKRDMVTIEEVEQDILVNTAYLCAYSAFSGAMASIIMNADGKLDDAVSKLKEIIKKVGEE